MLSTVGNYVLWLLTVALPQFLIAEPIVLFIALAVIGILISYLMRLTRIRF